MANFLSSLLSGLIGQALPATADKATELEGLVVMPPKRPEPAPKPRPEPTRNPYTDDYIKAAQAAEVAQAQLPRVSGATDAGLYGLLPKGIRQGRFRDILGAIGDGMLIGSGGDPIYQPRAEQRRMGQALIGYGQDPTSAAERLAQTGSPDSIKTATELFKSIQTAETKEQAQAALAEYRTQQNRLRSDQVIQRMGSIVPGVLARATTPEAYLSAYDRLDQAVKRLNPEADPTSAWGLPHPNDWSPEMTAWIGTTGGQQIGADISRERIQQSDTNNVRSTSTSAANNRRSTAQSDINSRRSAAQSDTNSRRSSADRNAAKSGKKEGGGLHTRNKPGAKTDTPTTKNSRVVTNGDVAYLKANPNQRANFEKRFGPGSAKKYLGK